MLLMTCLNGLILTYNDAMVEFQEYWDEYFTDTIQEVLEIHPNEK